MCESLPAYKPKDSEAKSPYQVGNFCPIRHEGTHRDFKVEGVIPRELSGLYVRNGTNQPFLPPTGAMHMFDGDAMLHCVRFHDGDALYYANTWIESDRAKANATKRKELYPTFGDLTAGGPRIWEKMVTAAKAMRSGDIPNIGKNRSHPSTATLFVGGKFFCLVEVCAPFQVAIDPDSGRATSGAYDDQAGRIEAFSAHPKTDPDTDEVFWFGLPKYTSVDKGQAHYGVLSPEGKLELRYDFPVATPFPAFLHDYFITKRFSIVVDHSLRMDTKDRIKTESAFEFRHDMNIKFGLIPRKPQADSKVRWFDSGRRGFVWHVVNAWEEGDVVLLFLNIFDFYPDTVPIHVAEEPPSHLWKYEINVKTGEVIGQKILDTIATERNDYNRLRTGKKSRYAYLMKRGENREMYDGFLKFDLENLEIEATVEYGEERFGGETLFVPKEEGSREDDGFLMDIVYDGSTGGSELCIWDASVLHVSPAPVARVHLPHRVPYGVHANWLSTEELFAQKDWFSK